MQAFSPAFACSRVALGRPPSWGCDELDPALVYAQASKGSEGSDSYWAESGTLPGVPE